MGRLWSKIASWLRRDLPDLDAVALGEAVTPPEGCGEVSPENGDPMPVTSWKVWRHVMTEMLKLEGWAPCRFANRLGPTDGIGWVYGVVSGDFGVWCQPFPCCKYPSEEERENTTMVLAALTHLPTGMGIGLFLNAATAAEAVHIITPLAEWRAAPNMAEEDDGARERWNDLMLKARAAWAFNGIDVASDLHAHNGPERRRVDVWGHSCNGEARHEGKPM